MQDSATATQSQDDALLAGPEPNSTMLAPGDSALLDACCDWPQSGPRFYSLWRGKWQEWPDYYPSQSEADSGFIYMLSKATNDMRQITRIFMASGLGWRIRTGRKKKHSEYVYNMVNDAMRDKAPIAKIELDGEWEKLKSQQQTNTPQIDETGAWANVIPLMHGPSIAAEPDTQWIIPGIIPYGHVTAIHAMSGVGKTTFALALAAALSNPQNATLKTGPILILTNEDTAARYRKRFLELDGVDDNFYCIDLNTTAAVWMLDDAARLENTLKLKPWALVVIDSLYSHKPSKYDIETKHADAAKLLLPLVPLAEKYCPILVIHHDNKQDTRTGAQKTSGSHGIVSSIRHHVRVSVDPDNKMRRIVSVFNTKIGSMQTKALVFEMEPFKWTDSWMDVDADEIVQAPQEPRKASVRIDTAGIFLDLQLAQGPQLASVIKANAEKVGIAEKTLQRARQSKGIDSVQLGKADGFVYVWGRFDKSVNKDALTLSMFPHLRPQIASK